MVSDKILILSLFVGCFYHKGPALSIRLNCRLSINSSRHTDHSLIESGALQCIAIQLIHKLCGAAVV